MAMIMWMAMMMISMRRRRRRTNIFEMRGQQGLNWVSRLSDINYDDDFKVKTMMVMMLMSMMMVMSMTMTTITFTMGGQQGGHGVSSSAAASPWNSLLLTSVAQHTCRVVDDGDDDDTIKL